MNPGRIHVRRGDNAMVQGISNEKVFIYFISGRVYEKEFVTASVIENDIFSRLKAQRIYIAI